MEYERGDIFKKLWLPRIAIPMVIYARHAGINYTTLSTVVNRESVGQPKSPTQKERLTINTATKIISVQNVFPKLIFLARDEVRAFFDVDCLMSTEQNTVLSALPVHVPESYLQLSIEVLRDEIYFILETLKRIEKERANRVEAKTIQGAFRHFHNLLGPSFVVVCPTNSSKAQLQLSPLAPREEFHAVLKTLERVERERGDPYEAETVKVQLRRLRNLLDTFLPR